MVDLTDRGLRTPMHTGLVTMLPQTLTPFFAAPLRPMETLVGMRLNGSAYFNFLQKIGLHIPVGYELSVWKVPLTALGDEFIDLVAGDAEDAIGESAGAFLSTGQNVPIPGLQAGQGHLSGTALGNKNRPWAGEIGDLDDPPTADTAMYARWVSAATWEVARNFYDLEYEDQISGAGGRTVPTLHDEPPKVADMIRGATYSGVTAGGLASHPDQPPAAPELFATSVAQWAEALSLMSTPNRTYAEYLQAFGVNPKRVRSLPEPYLYRRGMLSPYGSPISWHFGANWDGADGSNPSSENDFVINAPTHVGNDGVYVNSTLQAEPPTAGISMAGDVIGVTKLGAKFRIQRRRRLIVDEPSVLIGLCAWWPWMNKLTQYAHHMDMSQMVRASHWGVPTGGLDEADFLNANVLSGPGGAGTQGDEDQGGVESGIRAMNMLNLYLNGDSFCNDTARFGVWGPLDDYQTDIELNGTDQRVDANMQVKLAIATDMVS